MKKLVIILICMILSFSLVSAVTFTDVEVLELGEDGFVIGFETDVPSEKVRVWYGKTGALGGVSKWDYVSSKEHQIQVDGLEPGTVYFYRVAGTDDQGSIFTSAISLTRTPRFTSGSGNTGGTSSGGSSNNQPVDTSELKAFPSAQGHGRYASGGRGGDIYKVTNLKASGPGSLQYGLLNAPSKGRTIIFTVGGIIDSGDDNYIYVNKPGITIAGETAPGDGIMIRGELRVQASNVIVRHMRMRNHDLFKESSNIEERGPGPASIRIVAYNGKNTENVIADHLSLSWARDEIVTITAAHKDSIVRDVTLQNSIIYNNAKTGYALINYWNTRDISIYQNLFAYNRERHIAATTCDGTFEMINNYIYDYISGTNVAAGHRFDVIGNHFDSSDNTLPWGWGNKLAIKIKNPPRTDNCEALGKTNPGLAGTFVYYDDNLWNGEPALYEDEVAQRKQSKRQNPSNIEPYPASQVRGRVLDTVGAYNGLQQGFDSVDVSTLDKVRNDRGGNPVSTILYPKDFPTIKSGAAYKDTDNDGIADSWEHNINGQVGRKDNNGDHDGDGYTNLEEFLHHLAGEGHY